MINETLKDLLGEDLYTQISKKLESAENKDKVLITNVGDGSYLPRNKYNELNSKVVDLEKQITDRDTQLQDLMKNNKGNEEILAQLKQAKEANDAIKADYESKLTAQAREFAISEALTGAKAKNPKTILPLLDNEKIVYKDGKLEGLNEQLDVIRKESGYLFDATTPKNPGFNPGGGTPSGASTNDVMNSLIRGA